ncbi:MAG: hypothetical protein OHK0017_05440 [Patescibacteria group bacterium]
MNNSYSAHSTILINSDLQTVWNTVTKPYQQKLKTDQNGNSEAWQVGSSLSFAGQWDKSEYEDKGVIVRLIEHKVFEYAFWTKFSGRLDLPENYDTITFEFESDSEATRLTVTQNNYNSKEAADQSSNQWLQVLASIKLMLEQPTK